MAFLPTEPTSYHARVDTAGRVTIPAELRTRHRLHKGDDVLITSRAGALEIKTYDQILREVQDRFCAAAGPERVLSEELMAERRRDAALDD